MTGAGRNMSSHRHLISIVALCMTVSFSAWAALHAEDTSKSNGSKPAMSLPHPELLCYADNLPKDQIERIMQETELLPPSLLEGDLRFFTSSMCWTGNGAQAATGRAQPAVLTYSFPSDGVAWGHSSVGLGTGPNALNATFTGLFGAGNVDQGREFWRQAEAGWRKIAGLTYQEVADNDTPEDQSITHVTTRGDIRVGGYPMGTGSGVLAYNAFPNSAGTGLGGGDMALNTSFFIPGNLANPLNSYRYLRNVAAHEHGHGLAYIHPVPCDHTKLMEPFINVNFEQQQMDEIRGAQRNYGDRYAGNNSAANAKDFGNLTTPVLVSVVERNLSTNGSTGFNSSSNDWFKFTIDSDQDVVITTAPTGGSYVEGQQSSNCSGSTTTVNAVQAGNLNIELRDSTGTSTLQSAAAFAAGGTENLTANSLAAGTYTVRVVDVGPNANQTVQTYDLTIRVGSALAPPLAIAGLNKRVLANTNCYLLGDINSQANETGASLTGYDWDYDGDGLYDFAGAEPTVGYPSNGVFNATLRVTDSNGLTDTDTIAVTVYGATTGIISVDGSSGSTGQTVPVIIYGSNFKNVTSASMVSVSGSGVSVTGTPVSNALGTQLSGLSFVIDPGAGLGPRNVTVSNADGTGTGFGVFTIIPGQNTGDLNCDSVVDLNDIDPFALALIDPDAYAVSYPGCDITQADTNQDGFEDGGDIQGFVVLMTP
jgi:hypothetical protein